jgi:hypothetical protein
VLVVVLSESGRDFQKQEMCPATAVSSEQVKKRKAGMELGGGSYKRNVFVCVCVYVCVCVCVCVYFAGTQCVCVCVYCWQAVHMSFGPRKQRAVGQR